MDADKLLDAIGMIDDRHFECGESPRALTWRRRLIACLAAALILAGSVGTAMAVSPEFRALVFSIFQISTQETPPAADPSAPSQTQSGSPSPSGLGQLDTLSIDGIVHAHYFTSQGIALTYEGGFYTCSYTPSGAAPSDGAFWELREEGIVNIGAKRIEFPLTHGGRTHQIIFDYAILNGKLSIRVWPQGLDQNPVGNGWNVEAIDGRADIALLSVPVLTDDHYSHDYFLLELDTLEKIDLLADIPHDGLILDYFRPTSDLRYALIQGIDLQNGSSGYWLCDLEKKNLATLDALTGRRTSSPYFLDDSTLIFLDALGGDHFHLVSYHIPTGAQKVLLEDTTSASKCGVGYRGIQKNAGGGKHCLVFREDGSVYLMDLSSGAVLNMTGLNTKKLTTSESPDGSRILIAYEETNDRGILGYGFSGLGILNPDTGKLYMLTRDVSGNPETFWGWLNNSSVVITARDADGAYYVYIYEFPQ